MSSPGSPVQHALSVKELLCEIFSYSNTSGNAANARVCKAWSDEALNYIWYDVELRNLISLLAPLGLSSGWALALSRPIGASDWLRFNEYAWRVRNLSSHWDWDPSVFAEIALTSREIELIPNLTTLTIDSSGSYPIINLFGHSSVQSLTLSYFPAYNLAKDLAENLETIGEADSKLRIIPTRMPNLRTLSVQNKSSQRQPSEHRVVRSFAPVVDGLTFLEGLVIPDFWLTDPLISRLSSLPRLRRIEALPTKEGLNCALPPFNSDFLSLETLALTMAFNQATTWLLQCRYPKALTSLSLTFLESTPVDNDWPPLLEAITSQLHSLQELSLISPRGWGGLPSPRDLSAVRSLSRLRILHVVSPKEDRHFDEFSLVSIFQALPQLESFKVPHTRSINLSCLADIAHIAPKLEVFELTWAVDTIPVHVDHRFPRLKVLCGRLYNPSNRVEAALFLSLVLPQKCSVDLVQYGLSSSQTHEFKELLTTLMAS